MRSPANNLPGRGPNPKKVIIVLEELGIPYTAVSPPYHHFPKLPSLANTPQIPITNPKEESYTKINPNGRLPAIEDPNTGITLWESGAIIEYLVETYDKEQKLTFSTFPEKWQLRQYLYFQMSGQVRSSQPPPLLDVTTNTSRGPLLWPGCLVPHLSPRTRRVGKGTLHRADDSRRRRPGQDPRGQGVPRRRQVVSHLSLLSAH